MIDIKNNTELLKKRARAKFFTHSYIYKLINLDTDMKKSYFQTVDCAGILTQKDATFTAQYCNQRWCTVCNRIRIAKFVNAYGTQLKELLDPYFITLTVPNCTKENLQATLLKMNKDFQKIVDVLKKRGVKLHGIRKTEITYNHASDSYHPHFHLIVENFDGFFSENCINDLYYV